MQRHTINPRPHWIARVEETGLTYHSHPTGPYWDESTCYELTAAEIQSLESAANTLHTLCLEAAEAVIQRGWWERLAIPAPAIPAILQSWERDDFSLYGRFDLAFDGVSPAKLLEYNADTPTALLEAAVTQWFWLQETRPATDQFNSIHERLIAAWQRWDGRDLHFTAVKDHPEDEQTVHYLRDTAEQAGVATHFVYVEDIGWDGRQFVDLAGSPLQCCFKLYPWEWLWHEEFARHLPQEAVRFLEPAWKMLLSNKALLPILWELFPDHPNLLPAYDTPEPLAGNFVRKPKLSREGANISLVIAGTIAEEVDGHYGAEGHIYQALAPIPDLAGHHPVFGVWIVDHAAAGLGIREDQRRITGNLSRFVPHFFN